MVVDVRTLSTVQQKTFDDRYAAQFVDYKETTVEQMWSRVANAVAINDPNYFPRFRGILEDFKYVPGGRILASMGSGADVTAYNCFVLPSPEDSRGGIVDSLREWIEIQSRGGGVGINISSLRPRGANVAGVNGTSSGPIPWAHMFTVATRDVIQQGGSRRGAAMIMMNDTHPDLHEFITTKQTPGLLEGANVSVCLSDAFMEAVDDDSWWYPDPTYGFFNKVVSRAKGFDVTVERVRRWKAKEIFDLIISSAWASGEPGIYFLERANKMSNSHYFEELVSTNPCFIGSTKIETPYGQMPIQELVGQTIPVYTKLSDGTIGIRQMSNIRKTREKAEVWFVELDNGQRVIATPDHIFFGRDMVEVPLRDLQPGDSLAPFYRSKANSKGYVRLNNGEDHPLEHHVVAGYKYGRKVNYPEEHVNHINEVKQDNRPENLEILPAQVHNALNMWGDNNPQRRVIPTTRDTAWNKNGRFLGVYNDELIEIGKNFEKLAGKKLTSHNWSVYAAANGLPKQLHTKERFGSFSNFKNICANNHRVVAVGFYGHEDVYDGEVEETHNFYLASGVLVHNCGEQPLGPYSVCLLGSMNISAYVRKIEYPPMPLHQIKIDWEEFRKDVATAVRFNDNIIDLAYYPLPQTKEAQLNIRRMGIGIMGLADAHIKLGIKYGSQESLNFVEELYCELRNAAYEASVQLAKERGAFPKFKRDEYLAGAFVRTLPDSIRDGIAEHGIRNCFLLTNAPTGTTSQLAGVNSGIEPLFDRKWLRTDRLGEYEVSQDLWDSPFAVTSSELTPEQHIAVQAAAQKYIDSSISKTVNAPADATVEDCAAAYKLAYKSGLKSIAYYRDQSRSDQVLHHVEEIADTGALKGLSEETLQKLEDIAIKLRIPSKREPLPDERAATNHRAVVGGQKLYITVGKYDDGSAGEVFLKVGKEGSTIAGFADAFAVTVSVALQYGVPLEALTEKMRLTHFEPAGMTENAKIPTATSLVDYIGHYLEEKFLNKEDAARVNGHRNGNGHGVICPECGYALMFLEGCWKCQCGYSRC